MSTANSIPFDKMHGSGNDFVVIREDQVEIVGDDFTSFVQNVCRRGLSVGADGVIVIGDTDDADFSWHYYNADGSEGDMCGNGAMVGARYAATHGIAPERCTFTTPAGLIAAEVDGEKVTLQMMDARHVESRLRMNALPGVEFDRYIIGVPPVVGFMDDVDALAELEQIGRDIRHDPQLGPEGANVNVIHVIDEHTIRMRTYERGVEAETLACGTGAVCSAIAAARRGLVQQPVRIKVSSGLYLEATWTDDGDNATDIHLSGNARIVARGELLPDAFL